MNTTISHLAIDPQNLPARDRYRLLGSLVIPRPIAWISTLGADGSVNLAPFSFFNAVAGSPPTIAVSIGQRFGTAKDTLRNIEENGEFVVNFPSLALAQALNTSSASVEYGVDEFDLAGLEKAASLVVRPPRVAQAPAAMEAQATQVLPILESTYTLVLGQVVYFHIREDLLTPDGVVDAARFDPLLRLGGSHYAALGRIFEIPRMD